VRWVNREVAGKDLTDLRVEAMENCRLEKCDLRGARLSELITQGCTFNECNFAGANVSSSKHRGTSFLNCDFSGTELFGANLEHCRLVGSVFAEAILTAARIKGGDWSYSVLRMQELDRFDMREMKLEGADLYACSLIEADLRDSKLDKANLQLAKLTKADLRGASVVGVDFRNVEVKGARMTIDQALMFAMCYGIELE
jgi:fluoroquinolone resistance protein